MPEADYLFLAYLIVAIFGPIIGQIIGFLDSLGPLGDFLGAFLGLLISIFL